MKSSPLLIVIAILLAGCGASGAPTTPPPAKTGSSPKIDGSYDDPKSLFPLKEGNSWLYSIESQTQFDGKPNQVATGEVEYRVGKVEKQGGGMKGTVLEIQDGKKKDEQEWYVDDNGIYILSIKEKRIPFNPKQPVILFPLKSTKEVKWSGTGLTPIGVEGSMTFSFKNDGSQDVDTDMGSMNAAYTISQGTFKSKDGKPGIVATNGWFSPGVGLVRYRQVVAIKGARSNLTIRLKSYTVKK